MVADGYKISALDKGLRVLACFGPNHRSLGASEVSRLTKIPVSTCFRVLRTLADSEFVKQLDDGSFAPSAAVLRLGFAALQGNEIVEAVRSPLRDLQRKTHETCSLAVLSGPDILYLLRYKSDGYIIGNVVAGTTLPASITSMGKVLLATLSEDDLADILERIDLSGSRRGPQAIQNVDVLRKELAITRDRGWGMQNEEVAHGLRAISVPVLSMDGPVGAIAVSVEAGRWSQQHMIDAFLEHLQDAANKASINMGYLPWVDSSR